MSGSLHHQSSRTDRPPSDDEVRVPDRGCLVGLSITGPRSRRLWSDRPLEAAPGDCACRRPDRMPADRAVCFLWLPFTGGPDRPFPVAITPARAALRAGHRLEHQGSDESVDQYYRAAVYSYGAIVVTAAVVGTGHPDALEAREIYNEGLRDCLRPPRNTAESMRGRTCS